MIRFRQHRGAPLRATSSLSLRWRVMLLAMAMVAMVVVLMAFAVYAVISRDCLVQLHRQALGGSIRKD